MVSIDSITGGAKRTHSKGPIVRIVPDEVHIQDSEFYDTLYTKAGRVDKYDWMAGRFGCDTSVFTTGPDDLHRIRRGALNPLFSRQRIVDLQSVIREKLSIFMDRVREFQQEGKILPINRAFMALTGEVVMEYCFSISYGHLQLVDFEKTLHEPFMAASIIWTSLFAVSMGAKDTVCATGIHSRQDRAFVCSGLQDASCGTSLKPSDEP